jgi:hypothetical protein
MLALRYVNFEIGYLPSFLLNINLSKYTEVHPLNIPFIDFRLINGLNNPLSSTTCPYSSISGEKILITP